MRAFPSPRSAKSASATPRCWPRAAPTWASSAGSSTCRSNSPSPCSRPCTAPARNSGCAMPATTPSRACAWRRATAPGAASSRRTTRLSRPALAGRSSSTSRAASSARKRWSRPKPSRWHAASSRWCWRIASLCCGAARRLLRDGRPVGDLSSAGYGHTVGASVGLGYVKRADGAAIDAAWLEQAKFEVDLAGTRLKAKLSLRCPYDPTGARIKG